MKICFFTSPEPDQLQDLLLIGLRQIYGDRCVDFPKKEILYKQNFLQDIDIARDYVEVELVNGEFDLMVFGSVPVQQELIRTMAADGKFDIFHAQPVFLDSLPSGSLMKETYTLGPTFTSSPERLALIYLELPECAAEQPLCSDDLSSLESMARTFIEEIELITGKTFRHDSSPVNLDIFL